MDELEELRELRDNLLKPIGSVFKYKNVELIVNESYNCNKCYFRKHDEVCVLGKCHDNYRSDRKFVNYLTVE